MPYLSCTLHELLPQSHIDTFNSVLFRVQLLQGGSWESLKVAERGWGIILVLAEISEPQVCQLILKKIFLMKIHESYSVVLKK